MQDAVLLAMFLWQLQAPQAVQPLDRAMPLDPGSLSVHVASPQQITAGRGTQRVPMLSLAFAAACDGGPITMEEIHLVRTGLGASEDLSAVYAEQDGNRVSNAVTVPRDGAVTLRLRGFSIDPCDTRTITVLADIAPDADIAGIHRIALQATEPILSDAKTTELSAGPAFASVLKTAPQNAGSVEVSFPALLQRVSYGDNRTVARLRLTAHDRDQALTAITLTNKGSASHRDLLSLRLTNARGEELTSKASSLDVKRVRLTFDPPFILKRGTTVLLHLKADVRSGISRTIQFTLEEPSDLAARPVRAARDPD